MDGKQLRASFLAVPTEVGWCVVDQSNGEQVLVGHLTQSEAAELAGMLTTMGLDNLRPDAVLIIQGGFPVLWTGDKKLFEAR